MKYDANEWLIERIFGRTPQGVRGLKFVADGRDDGAGMVAPRKGCVG